MTCGVCSPASFQSGTNRVYGYIAAQGSCADTQARALYFMGAGFIFSDAPTGPIPNRKGFKRLLKVVRKGDRILIPTAATLGRKKSAQATIHAMIEAQGVSIGILKDYRVDP